MDGSVREGRVGRGWVRKEGGMDGRVEKSGLGEGVGWMERKERG